MKKHPKRNQRKSNRNKMFGVIITLTPIIIKCLDVVIAVINNGNSSV